MQAVEPVLSDTALAFKPIAIEDRLPVHELLWRYQPETSELTFTNLFIWRQYYGVQWCMYHDWLLVVFQKPGDLYALPPIGPAPREKVTRFLLQWLKEKGASDPRLERVDERLLGEIGDGDFAAEPAPEHFDYVYRSQDLIELAGRKYHSKRNFINTYSRTHRSTTHPLTTADVPACLDMAARWCRERRCEQDMTLTGAQAAVEDALANFSALQLEGCLIRLEAEVEAFALGELLNSQTAVVHFEEANPAIRGLYAVINQQFCEHNWKDVPFVNREQDLGEPQLRQAKLSYYPHHMVRKFRVRLRATA